MRRNSVSPCETSAADAADRSHRRALPRRTFAVAVLSIALLALAPRPATAN